jgi:beta-glucanase (GH16 family)
MSRFQTIVAVAILAAFGLLGLSAPLGLAHPDARAHADPHAREGSDGHRHRRHASQRRGAPGPRPAAARPGAARGAAEREIALAPAAEVGVPIWEEGFEGPAGAPPDPSRWSFDTGGGGWGNEELQSYTARPENAELDGEGHLVITARREGYTGADGIHRAYTSARLQTLGKFEFTYGTLEARIQVPEGAGLAPAFWTLGNDAYEGRGGWPGCGEIDAMEVLGSEPGTVHGHVHGPWPAYPNGIGGDAGAGGSLADGFHVYAVEWSPERISFRLDGRTYETVSRSQLPASAAWPFQRPNFILLNLAVGGAWPGAPSASTAFPARMLVDWVRVWS